MSTFRKIIIFVFIVLIIIPQVTLAAWWNPFSWKVFKKTKAPIEIQKTISSPKIEEIKNKSSASTKKTNTNKKLPTQDYSVPQNNTDINFLEIKKYWYRRAIQGMKTAQEEMRSKDLSYFKDRKNTLVYRLNYAKQITPLPNYGENIFINNMISGYWQAFENDIKEVDEIISNLIESNISLTKSYQEKYEKDLSLLESNPNQFITREEYIKFAQIENHESIDKRFKGLENISTVMRNYLQSVEYKEDRYESMRLGIANSLLSSINRL